MGKRGGLREAALHTGLSVHELRIGALNNKYPHMRLGGPRGKMWFDFDMLDDAIKKLMLDGCDDGEETGKIRPVHVE